MKRLNKPSFLLILALCLLNSACDSGSNHEDELDTASCDDRFAPQCGMDEFGNYARITCQDGVQVYETCPEGSSCYDGKCDCGSPNCCLKTEVGSIKYECDTYSSRYESSEAYKCSEDYDGRYIWQYYYEEQQVCFHGCDADTGKCKKIADFEGEACDYGMDMVCRDGFIASCEYGRLVAHACEDGSVCVELDGYVPSCEMPCNKSDVDKETKTCQSVINGDTGEIAYYYYVTQKCEQFTDTSGQTVYLQTVIDDVECKHSCDENGCTKLHPDEGKPCDEVENTDGRCEGNVFLVCAINCTNGKCKETFEAIDCGNQLCVEEIIDGLHIASCIENDPCEPSEVNKEKTVKCEYYEDEDIELASLYRCEKVGDKYFWRDVAGCYEACEKSQLNQRIGMECQQGYSTYKECLEEDGLYMWMEKFDYCKDGCDRETKMCHQASEHDECKAEEYKKTCEGTKLKGCVAGKIDIIEDCADKTTYYWGDVVSGTFTDTCVETDEGASCEPSCSKSDMNKYQLTCNEYAETTTGDICVESKNHTYYWDSYYENCMHGCNQENDGCLKLHPDEGMQCDDKYKEQCVDNIAIGCIYGTVMAGLCEDDTVCAVFDKHAQCAVPCSEADVAPIELTCDGYSEGHECVKQGDKYVWHEILEICTHGCNADGTCKHLYETEGEYCSSDSANCNGNMLHECNDFDNKIHIQDCAADGMTCISDGNSAKCAELCSEEEYKAHATKKACDKGSSSDYSYYKICEASYIDESKFEWMEDSNQPSERCDNGCNESTGECNE